MNDFHDLIIIIQHGYTVHEPHELFMSFMNSFMSFMNSFMNDLSMM